MVMIHKKSYVISWLLYYVLETTLILFVSPVLTQHNKYGLNEELAILLVTIMVFVDFAVHLLCFTSIARFIIMSKHGTDDRQRSLEQEAVSSVEEMYIQEIDMC